MTHQLDESLREMANLSNAAFAKRREIAKSYARAQQVSLAAPAGEVPNWRQLIDALPTPILVGDMGGNLLAMNLSASLLTGYQQSALPGLTVLDVVASRPEWTIAEFGRFVRDGEWRGELGFKRRDGSVLDVGAAAGRVEVNAGSAFFAPLFDISKQTRATDQRDRYKGMIRDQRNGRPPLERLAAELAQEIPGADVIEMASIIRGGINDMLEARSLEAGPEVRDQSLPSDLSEILHLAVERLRESRPNLKFSLFIPQRVLIGPWDKERIGRATSMLLNEAAGHSHGRGDLTVTATDNAAEVTVTISNETARLNGADLERLAALQPSKGKGQTAQTGDAPYLARLIIEQQGGRLWLEVGRNAHGFSLNFSLPRWRAASDLIVVQAPLMFSSAPERMQRVRSPWPQPR